MEKESQDRKAHRLLAQLGAAQNSRNWAEGEQVLQQMVPLLPKGSFLRKMYQLFLYDCKLYRGDLEQAKAGYLHLLHGGKIIEGSACIRLGRVAAERGDFVSSLHWVERYASARDSVCGSDIDGRRIDAQKFRTILRAAMGTSPEVSLRRIISGHFRTLSPGYSATSRSEQRDSAAQEARLILAECLLRQKRLPESKALFRELMNRVPKERRSDDERFILAEAHLKQIG